MLKCRWTPSGLVGEQALPIGRLDAEAAYGDLDAFRITIDTLFGDRDIPRGRRETMPFDLTVPLAGESQHLTT